MNHSSLHFEQRTSVMRVDGRMVDVPFSLVNGAPGESRTAVLERVSAYLGRQSSRVEAAALPVTHSPQHPGEIAVAGALGASVAPAVNESSLI